MSLKKRKQFVSTVLDVTSTIDLATHCHGEIECWPSAETLQVGRPLNVHLRAQSAACNTSRTARLQLIMMNISRLTTYLSNNICTIDETVHGEHCSMKLHYLCLSWDCNVECICWNIISTSFRFVFLSVKVFCSIFPYRGFLSAVFYPAHYEAVVSDLFSVCYISDYINMLYFLNDIRPCSP